MPQKDDLSKKIALEYDLFVLSGTMVVFFPENIIFFLWTENEK